jgi:hypothetical protein
VYSGSDTSYHVTHLCPSEDYEFTLKIAVMKKGRGSGKAWRAQDAARANEQKLRQQQQQQHTRGKVEVVNDQDVLAMTKIEVIKRIQEEAEAEQNEGEQKEEEVYQNAEDQIDVNAVVRVSDASVPLFVRMTGPPPRPLIRQVSRSHTHIEVSWQDGEDASSGLLSALSSMIRSGTAGSGVGGDSAAFGSPAPIIFSELECNGYCVQVPSQIASFRLYKLGHSQRHTFRVRSVNAHGKGEWSDEACFETLKASLQFCAQCGAYQGSAEGLSTLPLLDSSGLQVPTCAECGFGFFCTATYPSGLKLEHK